MRPIIIATLQRILYPFRFEPVMIHDRARVALRPEKHVAERAVGSGIVVGFNAETAFAGAVDDSWSALIDLRVPGNLFESLDNVQSLLETEFGTDRAEWPINVLTEHLSARLPGSFFRFFKFVRFFFSHGCRKSKSQLNRVSRVKKNIPSPDFREASQIERSYKGK